MGYWKFVNFQEIISERIEVYEVFWSFSYKNKNKKNYEKFKFVSQIFHQFCNHILKL